MTDLTFYYDTICKQPLLSREEEDHLVQVYNNPDSTPKQKARAREKLINANLRFVFKKAKHLSDGDLTRFEELISAGNEGLIVALDKFNPKAGVRFLTYAGWWVFQRQLKEMSTMRLVSVPVWKQQLSARIMKIVDASDVALTPKQIQERMPDTPLKDIEELMGTRYLTFYFEDMGVDNFYNETFLEELVESMDEELIQEKIRNHLTPMEASVIILHFGLDDAKEKPINAVANQLGLSSEEAKKLRTTGMKKLLEVFTPKKPESEDN